MTRVKIRVPEFFNLLKYNTGEGFREGVKPFPYSQFFLILRKAFLTVERLFLFRSPMAQMHLLAVGLTFI
jgi:hypothetical protein